MKILDTTNFTKLDSEKYKANTQAHWDNSPCGSNSSALDENSIDYFDEIEKDRYGLHPWIKEAIDSFDIDGKSVLEIGFGMGTDHINLVRNGATAYGIDLTPNNSSILKKRLQLYELDSNFICGDAENIPVANDSIDFVYSFGVIHHSPDTDKIVSEIHRILKPGGKCWITVYNKHSLFFWWSVFLVDWIFKGKFRRESLKERISRVEYPNDSPDLVIKLYTKTEFKNLFHNFSEAKASIEHLVKRDLLYIGDYLSDRVLDWLSKKAGWYIIVEATK